MVGEVGETGGREGPTKMNDYKIITWNVRGLGTCTKRYRVLSMMKRLGVKIACLQETHLTDQEAEKVRKKWKGQLFAVNYSSYARGTAIWIAPGTPFKMKYMEGDVEGRYIVLQGELDGLDIVLVNSYGPNIDDEHFYRNIQGHLADDLGQSMIWAGDFNCILNGDLDRTPPKTGKIGRAHV